MGAASIVMMDPLLNALSEPIGKMSISKRATTPKARTASRRLTMTVRQPTAQSAQIGCKSCILHIIHTDTARAQPSITTRTNGEAMRWRRMV